MGKCEVSTLADSERTVRPESPTSPCQRHSIPMPNKTTGRVGRAKRKSTRSRKGALTTARPLLANTRSHWGDMCEELRRYLLYRLGLAGGISTTIDKAHHRSRCERVVHRMRYTYFPKQELKFMPPENMFRSFLLDGWSDRAVRWVNVRFRRC